MLQMIVFRSAMVKPRAKLLSQWIADSPPPGEKIYLNREEDAEEPIGEGFEVPLGSLYLSVFIFLTIFDLSEP